MSARLAAEPAGPLLGQKPARSRRKARVVWRPNALSGTIANALAEEPTRHHPALLRSRAVFAAFPRNNAISTGPSENSPALAFAVKTRR